LSVACFALAVLAVPAVGGANPSHAESALHAQDAAIARKSRSVTLGLYALDQHLAAARARLSTLHGQAHSLRAQRVVLRLERRVAHRSIQRSERELAQQIRALYEQGQVEPIEVVFGARSLDEAMTNLDDLSRSSSAAEEVVAELKSAKSRLAAASRALDARMAQLAAATRAAATTAASLTRTRAARVEYIASLATERRLTERQIASAVVQAQAAQLRSQRIAPPTPAPVHGGRTLTVVATGYSLGGRTSTGLPVGWGVAAVDPSVIPLGTHMSIPGYGDAVAADTGGAVHGAVIDLWFPTTAQANAWGRRTVTIALR
jgi:3D (Asp-Asp-Asp) domain-containing protein